MALRTPDFTTAERIETAIGAGWVNVSSLGPGITLQRAPGEPSPRRGVRLVGQPDDVRQPLDSPAGQLLLELAQDPDAGGRVVEDGRPDADHGRTTSLGICGDLAGVLGELGAYGADALV